MYNQGIFTIEMKKSVEEVFVTDLSGKIIKKIEPRGEKTFITDISGFPYGIYLLKFMIEGKWYTGKVIVQGPGSYRY